MKMTLPREWLCAWLCAWLRAWLQVIVNRIKKREEKIIRARGAYFLTTNLTNLHESWGVDLRSLFLYGLMDLMDLLRTPWRVGALYLYGLIYISTDFWDFKDFWSADGGQAVLRVLEVRREKKRHDDGRNGHRLWRFIGVYPTPMSIKIFTSPPLNRGGGSKNIILKGELIPLWRIICIEDRHGKRWRLRVRQGTRR